MKMSVNSVYFVIWCRYSPYSPDYTYPTVCTVLSFIYLWSFAFPSLLQLRMRLEVTLFEGQWLFNFLCQLRSFFLFFFLNSNYFENIKKKYPRLFLSLIVITKNNICMIIWKEWKMHDFFFHWKWNSLSVDSKII